MKNIFYIILAIFALNASPIYANETTPTSAIVEVKGMVCDFCAQSLKKVFGKKEAVKDIAVDLDTQMVTVNFKNSQRLTDAEIEEAITWAGYDIVKIEYQ